MDSSYKYAFSPSAVEDIDDALSYITYTLLNPEAAELLYRKIFDTIEANLLFPYGLAGCELYGIGDKRFRHAIVNNYVLFFRIDEEIKTLWIVRFLYAGRNIKPELFDEV